jgi:hypothetical protein
MNKKWNSDAIDKLCRMAGFASPEEIAAALNTTRASVIQKASEKGISLRTHRVKAVLPQPARERLECEARRRGLHVEDLARRIFIAVIRDDMFDAVLDDDLANMKPEQAAHAFIR